MDLLKVLDMLEAQVVELDEAVGQVAFANAGARLLMTQPGVGPITALAFVVTIGDWSRFKRGKQVASYLGLIPSERSSGQKRRLGAISKQGNVFLRTMLVEAAQSAVRHDEQFKKEYAHRCHSKPTGVAKVAAARKLAVRLYWMLRTQTPYAHAVHNEGSPSHPVVGAS
jgi:transposase